MQETMVRKGVRAGVDKNGVPTNWYWEVDRMLTFDDGTSAVMPMSVPFTSEELATHVSAALAAQQTDLAADAAERDALRAERDALATAKAQAEAERDALLSEKAALAEVVN